MNSTNSTLTAFMTSQVPSKGEHKPPYILIVISGFIIVFGIISFIINMKTSKLATNIRYMTGNIIFYDICVVIAYVLHYSILDSPTWLYYRATQYSILGQWFSVMGFIVERLIAIMSPLKYRVYFRKAYIKAFILGEFSCYVIILVFTAFNARDPYRAIRVCWVALSLHTTFSVVSLVSCIKTVILFKSSLSKTITRNIRIISRSKETISIFCILFVVLHVPIGIETFVLRCEFDPTKRLYTSYLIIVNSALDPLIYVWKLKKCRLQALRCLSWWPCFMFIRNIESINDSRKFSIATVQNIDRKVSNISNRRLYSTADSAVFVTSVNTENRLSSIENNDVCYTIDCTLSDIASTTVFNNGESKMSNFPDSDMSLSTEMKISNTADMKVSNREEIKISYTANMKVSNSPEMEISDTPLSKCQKRAEMKISNIDDMKMPNNQEMKISNIADIKMSNNPEMKISNIADMKVSNNQEMKISNNTDMKV